MDEPLVSVIVPVFNAENFIADCIDSFLNQTYVNTELILVDDFSSDRSVNICEEYVKKENRVKLFRLTSQSGVSKARNCGLVNAKGSLVCFVDSDDFIDEDFVERMVASIQKNKVNAVFGRYKYFQNGIYLKRPIRISEGLYSVRETSDRLIDDGTLTGILFGSVCGAIYNAEFIRNHNIFFDETLVRNEDGVFNLVLLSQSKEYYVIDYDGYSYRQWKGQKRFPVFEPDKGLEDSTSVIMEQFKTFDDLKTQLQRRAVSIVFWDAIRIGQCDGKFSENYKRLKQYILHSSLEDDFQSLRIKEIGRYKRLLIEILYKKHIFIFCVLMKYVYPKIQGFR